MIPKTVSRGINITSAPQLPWAGMSVANGLTSMLGQGTLGEKHCILWLHCSLHETRLLFFGTLSYVMGR